MTDADVELARFMYGMEREDERAFWGSLSALILGSLTLIAGASLIVSLPASAYYVLPFVPVPAFCFYVHQGVVGARRREYMVALEHVIAHRTTAVVEVSSPYQGRGKPRLLRPVPLVAHQRYAWRLTAVEPDVAPASSRALLVVMSASPALLLLLTLGAACTRVWNDSQHAGAVWLGSAGLAVYVVLYLFFWKALRDHATWTDPGPALRD